MMNSTVTRAALVLVLLGAVALPQPAHAIVRWTEDAAKAQTQATKEGKDLLMNFTGSDWCGWCIKLKKEVFTKEPFATEGPKKFVFVMLDFPRSRKMPDKVKQQNAEWRDKLGVRGYPTIYLLDAKGRPYARTGYQRGGPEKYMAHLNELQQVRIKRDKLFAQAAKAKGTAKAKLLHEAISLMSQTIALTCYGQTVDEIIKLDPDDEAGLKSKYAAARAAVRIAEQVNKIQAKVRPLMAKKNYDGAVKVIDKALEGLKGDNPAAQDLYMMKSYALFQKGDKPGAIAVLKAGIKLDPKSKTAARMKDVIQRLSSDDKGGKGGSKRSSEK
jgi:thioredoxin-related protein